MKRVFLQIAAVIITCLTGAFAFFLLMVSGGGSHVRYYSNLKNYVKVDAVITYLNRADDGTICLNIELKNESFSAPLRIIPENAVIACENGFMEEVKVGDHVYLASAPAYFGDGYILPIVGFKKDDKVYLDFKTGVSNQVAHQKSIAVDLIKLVIFPATLTVILWAAVIMQNLRHKRQQRLVVENRVER